MPETRVSMAADDLDKCLKQIRREGKERIVSIVPDGSEYVVRTAPADPPLETR